MSFPKIRSLLKQNKAQAILLGDPPNITYLTGFTGTSARILITERNAWFITDTRYQLTAESLPKIKDYYKIKIITKKRLYDLLKKILKKENAKYVILDSSCVTIQEFFEIQKFIPENKFIPLPSPLTALRIQKTSYELHLIEHGLRIAEKSFLETLKLIRSGITEQDIRTELEYRFSVNGAEGPAFDTIIASGPNAAIPHATVSRKKISNKEMIIMDFGIIYHGYRTDTTRTVHMGKPSATFTRYYKSVLHTMHSLSKSAGPGEKAGDLDKKARKILEKQKLAKYFTHSLGHGVGIEIHEQPYLNSASSLILKPGMVITIEPGIYIKNWGGIRIEDMIQITRSGTRTLTKLEDKVIIL